MLNLRKIVDPVVAILSCALLSTGCTKEESAAAGSSEEQHKVTVQLNISTRAVEATDGSLETGESDLYSLRVYAFAKGTLVGHDFRTWTDGITLSESSYLDLDLDLTMVSASTAMVDFYVVANEAAMLGTNIDGTLTTLLVLGDEITENQLNNFSFTGLDLGSDNDLELGLPMYWMEEVEIDFSAVSDEYGTDEGHENHKLLAQTVAVTLQRPMGKLGVFAAKAYGEEGTLQITSLTMLAPGNLSYNYLMPQTNATLGSTGYDIELTPITSTDGVTATFPASYDSEYRNDPSNYTPVLDEPYYPFENPWGSYDWSTQGGETEDPNGYGSVLQIGYTFDGLEYSRDIYLPPIERNTYYAVLCLMHNGAISITINVADWDDPEEGTYVLDFDYPTYSPLVPANSTGDELSYEQPTVYYNSDPSSTNGSYFFRFTITGPTGQEWTPTLLDATTADFEVTVLQGGVVVEPPYVADPDESYEIQVRALNSANVGKTVQLAIAFTPSWDQTGGSSLLLINSDRKWEGSSYTDRVVIRQTDTQ